MKKKMRNVLQITSLILCAVMMINLSIIGVKAEELPDKGEIYQDTEQGRFVSDFDEYMAQLNAGIITPYDPVITGGNSGVATFDLSEPSKKCSNIFGHKWDDNWTAWQEVSRHHYSGRSCLVVMERWHYCKRTHCGASQKETDYVWVTCNHQ